MPSTEPPENANQLAEARQDNKTGSNPVQQQDTREQPWKKYMKLDETRPVTFIGDGNSIRLIEGRTDGKNIGG